MRTLGVMGMLTACSGLAVPHSASVDQDTAATELFALLTPSLSSRKNPLLQRQKV